ncbi:hypothetical protein CFOL_v3_10498 [Cephalotus follicularis]|uniref:GIR1-like zinc ribbon domain-containing protein n=1 Tax=Cephalotus follicularis TaxID=3775 RepID=A0A1Q3BGG1_CEPFO|nr:hypothetical protein CFOL_v3_10498 [Cephalotus follicularis]
MYMMKYTSNTQKKKVCLQYTKMSRRANSPKLELKLNLSPPRANSPEQSPKASVSSCEMSPKSSCVSLEADEIIHYASSPEATTMVLVGCPRCLMYVMISEVDPQCPKCKSTVLLDFLNVENKRTAT